MKKTETASHNGLVEIPPFDFEHSQANKFASQYDEGAETLILDSEQAKSVILEADVAAYFPDSDSVNTALRALISAIPQIFPLIGIGPNTTTNSRMERMTR